MTMALAGVRVLDFTRMVQGPYATQMLGDLGADIIKVEMPRTEGMPVDERYGRHGQYTQNEEDNTFVPASFLTHNRNKKSITINLKSEAGKEIIRRLLKQSDIVYENFRPGVMDRLGIGYRDCCEINPSIIYVSATGFGDHGPYVAKPGQDNLAQARAGIAALNATPDGRPLGVAFPAADYLGAMNGVIGVLAALYHRQATGEGQQVSVSLLDGLIAIQSELAVHFLNTGEREPLRFTSAHTHPYISAPYGMYKTKDGYIAITGSRTDHIPRLCRILGIPNLPEDTRFDTYAKRGTNRPLIDDMIEEALSCRTTAEWIELMEAEGLWVAPVRTFAEALSDPQVMENEMIVTTDSPVGPLKLVAAPFKLSKTPANVRSAPPLLGQHTSEVLSNLGYDEQEIEELRKAQVV